MKKCMPALLSSALLIGINASAATITVTSNSNSKGVAGPCTIRDAITAANSDTASGGCTAGNGDDIIELQSNLTITLTESDDTGFYSGLPLITSNITINGNGSIVRRDPALMCAMDGTARPADFRILQIAVGTPATSRVTINDLTLSNGCNEASSGGGISSNTGLTLNRVVLKNNKTYFAGGGVFLFAYPGLLTPSLIDSCLVIDNQSQYFGGGIEVQEDHSTNIRNSLIQGNQVTGTGYTGGGISIRASTVNLLNSTITSNSAPAGAGVDSFSTTASLAFSTIANNTNTGSFGGGGINAAVLPSEVMGLVLDGNSPNNCSWGATPGMYPTNLSSDMSCSFDIQGVSAQLLPLAYNGGNTQTMALTPGIGNPAINVANCQTTAGAVTQDQRGHGRLYTAPLTCDLGAYEEDSSLFSDSFEPILR